ncbi:MAG: DNA polymerase Y family protein [Sphingomicrobium sp.]
MTRRICSIWWPHLAIERWLRTSAGAPDGAIVLVEEAQHGQRIVAVTRAAAEAGARPGMRLTDARALFPALAAVAWDSAGDTALVERLARWAGRWSPLVEIDGGDGMRMDVTGVAHLFGGEAGLCAEIEAGFAGLTTRVAVAGTAGAAWALARYSSLSSPVAGEGEEVAHLPIAALRLSPEANRTLDRLGLKTIGALAGVPRRSLARRFREADNPIDALDRLLGRTPEPLTPMPLDLPPRSTLRLADPIDDPGVAGQALAKLAGPLADQLARRRLGARRVMLSAWRVDGEVREVAAETSLPTRDSAHLVRLLADKAGMINPGFGIDAFALTASWCEPLAAGQDSLIGQPSKDHELARLVDRLTVRLGKERVRRPLATASHLPERASGWVSAVNSSPALTREQEGGGAFRPQRLLDRPEAIGVIYATPEGVPRRFTWRRKVHDIARVEGPERIAPEWWRARAKSRLRDYYRVEDDGGRRFWIFREGLVGDGRGGTPGWFVHGLFG